jgi:diacylglycerol kinase (ATP)
LESFHARRAAIIYNPVARGLSRHLHSLPRIIAELARKNIQAELVATTGPGTAGQQARRKIEAGCDLILTAGGDGTINETATGMLGSGVPLGILPGGTANVLAREIHLPGNMEKVAAQLTALQPRSIAVGAITIGKSERRPFICMAGAGLDADIVSKVNLDLKAAAGKLAYYVGGFSQVFRTLPEFQVFVDGRSYLASFALISRLRNYGGDLEIARGASLLRDDFEVVLFRGTYAFQYLPYLVGVALKRVHNMRGCTVVNGRSVRCEGARNARVWVQVDGELAGTLPVTAEILPDALQLLMPVDYIRREESFVSVPACA